MGQALYSRPRISLRSATLSPPRTQRLFCSCIGFGGANIPCSAIAADAADSRSLRSSASISLRVRLRLRPEGQVHSSFAFSHARHIGRSPEHRARFARQRWHASLTLFSAAACASFDSALLVSLLLFVAGESPAGDSGVFSWGGEADAMAVDDKNECRGVRRPGSHIGICQ